MLLYKSNDNAGKNGQNQLFHDWKLIKAFKNLRSVCVFWFFSNVWSRGFPVVQWLRVCLNGGNVATRQHGFDPF